MTAPSPILIPEGQYDRRKFIGSSNVAAIMGLAPEIGGHRYTSLDVYLAKLADSQDADAALSPDESLFLKRRKRWEGPVVEHLREEFDAEIVYTNRRARDPEVPFFAAEADWEWMVDPKVAVATGLDGRLIGTLQHGETKTVSPRAFGAKFGWGEPGTDQIPIHYWIQVQFSMAVWRREIAIVAALIGLDEMLFYVVHRADDDIAEMTAKCKAFWNDHVLLRIPPEPQTLSDLDRLYKNATPGMVVDGTSIVGSQAMRLRAIQGQIESLELEAEAAEFEVKRAMGSAEDLVVDGRKVFTWKESNFGYLDQESLKTNEKVIHKKYFLTGRRRVFKRMRSS